MTQEDLAAIRLIVREELEPLFDHIERLDVHIMELEELLEGDAVAREKNRLRQRRFKAKKKAQVTPGNLTGKVTHNGNVTFAAGNAVPSGKVTLPTNRVTGNGSSPSSPPRSPSHTLPLTPPLTPPSPVFSYATRDRVAEWCAKKKFKVMVDFAWGKIRLHERFNPPISNFEDFNGEMHNIKSMWLKEKE